MPRVSYTVTATLPDQPTRLDFVRWLKQGHTDAVICGGAASVEIVVIEEPASPPMVQVRYVFPDRTAYDRYVQHFAPALRAEGLRMFGPEKGVSMSRHLGTIQ
ncbi:hypothetical protein PHYC_03720 [Phycisphaerales bacterium]|nr:hypothetical protein PHYC_03720 [Phycisphaerales bacterium]